MAYTNIGVCWDLLCALSNPSTLCAGKLLLGTEKVSELPRIQSEIFEIKKKHIYVKHVFEGFSYYFFSVKNDSSFFHDPSQRPKPILRWIWGGGDYGIMGGCHFRAGSPVWHRAKPLSLELQFLHPPYLTIIYHLHTSESLWESRETGEHYSKLWGI